MRATRLAYWCAERKIGDVIKVILAIGRLAVLGKRAQKTALICKACVFAFGTVLSMRLVLAVPLLYAPTRAMNAPNISIIDRAHIGPPPPIRLAADARLRTAIAAEPTRSGGDESPQAAIAPTASSVNGSGEPRISLRKRLAVLFAAIAVPAMAAPGGFGSLAADAPVDALAAHSAMPFERPGMSFPGSAFYYLADPPSQALIALPSSDPSHAGAEGDREIGQAIDAGPAARPIFAAGAGIGHARAVQCLAQAVWYEAASESEAGQRAVAQVVLNRVAHPGWPGSVCGVVYQGSDRSTGCQFSFTCDGSLARRASGPTWARAQRIASAALAGEVYAPIGHATHYHTLWVNPYWAGTLDVVGTIGAHRFYRNRGVGGMKDAFTERYSGNEPMIRVGSVAVTNASVIGSLPAGAFAPTGIPGNALSTSMPAAPSARSADTSDDAARRASANASPFGEHLASPALRSAGQAREEYAKAGQWKRDPSELDLKTRNGPEKPAEK